MVKSLALATIGGAALMLVVQKLVARSKPRVLKHVVLFSLKPEASEKEFVAAFDAVGLRLKELGIVVNLVYSPVHV